MLNFKSKMLLVFLGAITLPITSCKNSTSININVDGQIYDFCGNDTAYLKTLNINIKTHFDFSNQTKIGWEISLHQNINKILFFDWKVNNIGRLEKDTIVFQHNQVSFDLYKNGLVFKTINFVGGTLEYLTNSNPLKVECNDHEKVTSGEYLIGITNVLFSYDPIGQKVNYFQEYGLGEGSFSYFQNIIGDDNKKYFVTRNNNYTPKSIGYEGTTYNFSNITILDENLNKIKSVERMLWGSKNINRTNTIETHDAIVLGLDHYILATYIKEDLPYFDKSLMSSKKCLGVYIQEILQNNVVWEWESGDYEVIQRLCDSTADDYKKYSDHYVDDIHFNSMALNKENNSLTISLRNGDALINIKKDINDYKNSDKKNFTPPINWIVTNNYNNIQKNACVYADKIVSLPGVNFSCQHFIKYLGSEGNLSNWSFFNNHSPRRDAGYSGPSEGVSFSIDETNLEIKKVKTIKTTEEIWSLATGNCYQIENSSNWLFCWGIILKREQKRYSVVNELVEKTDGSYESIFDMYFEKNNSVYRAYKTI